MLVEHDRVADEACPGVSVFRGLAFPVIHVRFDSEGRKVGGGGELIGGATH
jgi:hypothetical protein